MDEYIERELTDTEEAVFKATVAFIVENEYPPSVRELCEITGLKSTNTIHDKLTALERKGYISTQRGAPRTIRILKDRPDVVEVRHGRWHILSEDPYDESDCPTEEGWYRIITTDGEEMTDYFFPEPTLSGRGVVYWKNCKKGIRAWAKMDGKGEGE